MSMKAWSAALLVLLAGGVHAADVSEIAFNRTDDSFPAYSGSGGTVRLQSRHSVLTAALPEGGTFRDELMVLFDRGTGYYLWDHDHIP